MELFKHVESLKWLVGTVIAGSLIIIYTTDHSCRRLAEEGMASPHNSREELLAMRDAQVVQPIGTSKSLVQKIKGWFFKK
jgi:hypothetical protein